MSATVVKIARNYQVTLPREIREIIIPFSIEKRIRKLPQDIRKKFYWGMDVLMKNERHPSLRHKKIQGTETYWELSITMNYRVIYRRESEKAFLVAIGKHKDVF